ncbi:cutinase family protein [Nocardia abscessus]|uniref:cutinase family protein n=1 Tax=Nocardia abscessus TaxID=120957 RepID=UPI001894B256|nr:cutinase family protein [Nocardia abscessus]MBF6339736.1 cutinase family protein [Nocardia abscessus]
MSTETTHRARIFLAAAAVATALGPAAATTAGPAAAVPIGPGCPALYVLGVQGTGQSSPTADPLADTGVVGALIAPVLSAAPGLVQRSYISYGAGFGGAVPGGGPDPYVVSVTDARRQLDAAAVEIAETCPATLIAGIGYSQGAQAMSSFAHDVGTGAGPVAPERVAGIALYAHPDRAPDAPIFPGRPGQTVPDPAPGTSGAAVAGVQITNPAAGGGGIADGAPSYGALTGRVADICTDGDLACSAPERAALLRVGAEIAAQADLRDPFAAVGSLAALFSAALGDTWTTVVLGDFQVGGGTVDYAPQLPLAARLIAAADPRIPAPSPHDIDAAAARWNEITATVAANPLGLLPKLAGQLGAAWGQLVADNADLVNPAVWVRFADTVARHNNYAITGQLASGIAWMVALAHDIAGSR